MINYRILEQHYPHPATESDYMEHLVNATEASNCDVTNFFVLHTFKLEKTRLQVGGSLLPDLIELYQWIHTQLSYLVTDQRAKQINIGDIIRLSAKRYSKEYCNHLTDLFKKVISKS